MTRIDECQVTNEWNDITTFSYFRLALRGQADKWLSSVVRHLQLMLAQKTWTRIRRSFKTEFAAFSDNKLTISRMSRLSGRNRGNKTEDLSQISTGATIVQGVKTTGPTTTATTVRTTTSPISPNPMLPEMVNSVSIAK